MKNRLADPGSATKLGRMHFGLFPKAVPVATSFFALAFVNASCSTNDATSPAQNVVPEASVESNLPDGGGKNDDATATPPTTSFCTTEAKRRVLCVDFDDQSYEQAGLQKDENAGATIALDDKMSRSAPRSLVIRTPELILGTEAHAALTKSFPPSFSGALDLEFDVFIDPNCYTDDQAAYGLATLQLSSNAQPFGVSVIAYKTGAQLAPVAPPNNVVATGEKAFFDPLKPGQWTHVTVALRLESNAKGTMNVRIDDPKVDQTRDIRYPLPNEGAALHVGAFAIGGAKPAACEIHYDNVALSMKRL